MFKKDNILFGLLPGLLTPLVIALMLYKFWAIGPLSEFYRLSIQSGNLTKLLALGCFLNLAVFFLFIRMDRLRSAQGVIFGTFFYVFVTVYFLFIR